MSDNGYNNCYLVSALLHVHKAKVLRGADGKTRYAFDASQPFGRKTQTESDGATGNGEKQPNRTGWNTVSGYFSTKAWKALESWHPQLTAEEKENRSAVEIVVKRPRMSAPHAFVPKRGDSAGKPVAVLNYSVHQIVKVKPKGAKHWIDLETE